MLQQIQEQLVTLKEQVRTRRKLEAMLAKALSQWKDAERRHHVHRGRVADEKSDVDSLEGYSLTALFCSILGTKEQRLDKERQEFLAAKLKLEEAELELQQAQQEIDRLRQELSPFSNVDREYDALLAKKYQLLVESSDPRAETILGMDERIGDLSAERKELDEAIRAGEAALRELQSVRRELQSAQNWGTWDLMGGGMMVTMAKHSRIDTAKRCAHSAQRLLNRFEEELADTGERFHFSVEIDGFSTFADYFFDGLIADWIVQSKLQNASSACAGTISRVESALGLCRGKLRELDELVESKRLERQQLLEQ